MRVFLITKREAHFPGVIDRAVKLLLKEGHEVVMPPEEVKPRINTLLTCEAVYLVPGAMECANARIEKRLAEDLGLTVLNAKRRRLSPEEFAKTRMAGCYASIKKRPREVLEKMWRKEDGK
jgi:hypothetical protein